MPLVRIDVIEGRSDEEVRALADAVQDVMMEVFAAPARDRYQVIHEHRPGRLIAEDTGLGLERSDRVVIIQVTEQGRSDSQKKALYAALASSLESRAGVSPSDLIVSVVANTSADWSFGLGRAQFLEGDLLTSRVYPAPQRMIAGCTARPGRRVRRAGRSRSARTLAVRCRCSAGSSVPPPVRPGRRRR
jgi:phenylpyruvate tautomerase PptA (4-oxalocrotonate tautomerase family)